MGRKRLQYPPQNRSNRNHALAITSLSAISDRLPSFSRSGTILPDTFVSHRFGPFSPRPGEKRDVAEARRQTGGRKASHRCTVIPGRVFWVGCTQDCGSQGALSSRNTTAEETKIIPLPPHSVASRNALFPPRRPLRFLLSRGSPSFSLPTPPSATTRSFAFIRRVVGERGGFLDRREGGEIKSGETKINRDKKKRERR